MNVIIYDKRAEVDYATALEQFASSLGRSPEELLAAAEAEIASMDYPGEDCLTENDLAGYGRDQEISLRVQEHVRSCDYCNLLIASRGADQAVQSVVDREIRRTKRREPKVAYR